MNYEVLELPLNTTALALQTALNALGQSLVSIVADTVNKRFIIVFKK